MSYSALGILSPCSPGYTPGPMGPCIPIGSKTPVIKSGTPFNPGLPPDDSLTRDEDSDTTPTDDTLWQGSTSPSSSGDDGSLWESGTPSSSGGGGAPAYYDEQTDGGSNDALVWALGAAAVLTIGYWFYTQVG